MRSGLLLLMVAAMIAAGCRTVSYQTADSAAVESAVFSSTETELAEAFAAFLYGRLIEEEDGQGSASALPYFHVAAQKAPGSHTVYSRIAVEGMRRGDLAASIAAMESSYNADPDDPIRQIDLGALYQLAFQIEEAAELFHKALGHQPTNTTLYIALGDIYFTRAQDEKALEVFAKGFTHADAPESLTTYLNQQIRRFISRGELKRAIHCLELLAQWNKDDRAELEYMIGELHIAREAISDALAAFYRTIEHPSAPAAAFLRLGAILMEKEDAEEAIRVMRSGNELFPNLVSFPFALGGLYAEEGQYEEALLAYENAVRIAKQEEHHEKQFRASEQMGKNLLIAMAAAQERLKRFDDAAKTLETVLEKHPDSHIAMNFLAYMWAELDINLDEAYVLSRRSLEMEPDNGAYLDTLGWIYYRMGKYEKALTYLEWAREQLGSDPEIILHFGDVYAAKGDAKRAKQYWKESVLGDATPENRAWTQLENIGIDPQAWLESQEQAEAKPKDCQTKESTKDKSSEDQHRNHTPKENQLEDDTEASEASPYETNKTIGEQN